MTFLPPSVRFVTARLGVRYILTSKEPVPMLFSLLFSRNDGSYSVGNVSPTLFGAETLRMEQKQSSILDKSNTLS